MAVQRGYRDYPAPRRCQLRERDPQAARPAATRTPGPHEFPIQPNEVVRVRCDTPTTMTLMIRVALEPSAPFLQAGRQPRTTPGHQQYVPMPWQAAPGTDSA